MFYLQFFEQPMAMFVPQNQAQERTRSKPKAVFDSCASGFAYGSGQEEIQQKLSVINGNINKMTKEQLQAKLRQCHLNAW